MLINMFCKKCGANIEDGSLFCSSCGAKQDAASSTGDNSTISHTQEKITTNALIKNKKIVLGVGIILAISAATMFYVNNSVGESYGVGFSTKMLAVMGNADAQVKVGERIFTPKKVEWFRKAAEQGNARAQYLLGRCFWSGDGVVQDEKEAVMWFQKAANQDYARAQATMGDAYNLGRGVKRNLELSVEWMRKAANQGLPYAQYCLGFSYFRGDGVTKDEVEAVRWYEKAVAQGYAAAMVNLGLCYEYGMGIEKNVQKAFEMYKKASDKGEYLGTINLASMYERGVGVQKNLKEAFRLYKKIAEKKGIKILGIDNKSYIGEAACNVGRMYQYGLGVDKNPKEAVVWYKKAEEFGNANACSRLAVCYFLGDGVEVDYQKAYALIRKAADMGDELGKELLPDIEYFANN
ncbi:zinc-ribbon domain-containing protein [Phascolarctobacterium sp.]|uniref:SEL1-like repeat protein n=1 Tax=Phascolarctobacterium sp. TaxID=2049039 RepID=UPI00386F1A5A